MDEADHLNVRFHYGGEFVRIGPQLDYVGGDEGMSKIERDKLSFPELKGHLKDHLSVKKSMKYYWLVPGKALYDGLMFLYDDNGCMKMSDHITSGGVADVYVEYFGEEEDLGSTSGSDFEDEIGSDMGESDLEQPDLVITTAEHDASKSNNARISGHGTGRACVPGDIGAIPQVISGPSKHNSTSPSQVQISESSQVLNAPSQPNNGHGVTPSTEGAEPHGAELSNSDSDDNDYVPNSDDSGEDEETVELRRHAKMYMKKLRTSQRWVESNASGGAVPVDLLANIEEIVEDPKNEHEFDSDDEDYSYDDATDEENEHIVRRKSKYARYDPKSEIPHFSLAMVFRSKDQMRRAVQKYGLKTKRIIIFMKSEENRVRAKCGWPGCPWLIYAAKTSRCSRFQVVTYEDEHHCAQNRDNRLVTAKVIAKKYEHFILANSTWKIDSLKATILKELFCDVSPSKCKAAKKIVMDKLFEGMKGEYTKVFDYQLELLRSNPGSTVAVGLDPTIMDKNVFQRFYVCFNALKIGFKAGCRRVIGLDGCFFKGACQGELLCAIGRDANNQMYPVAWAVVQKETTENWQWFLGLLIKDLNINDNGAGWVFISDQQKGLINSMITYLLRAEHRMCARHIYANWRKKYRAHALQKKFWAVAKAGNREDFNYYRAKLALETPQGAKDMMNTEPQHWARAFFPTGSKCESVDNNLCESFNHSIIESRFHPIISMLEKIRCKVTVRIQENRTKCEKWHGTICPNIFKKLKVNIKKTADCDVLWNGKDGFEVRHVSGRGRRYTVNLDKRICSCGYFQLSGLPCCHAISAIYKCGKQIDDYIDKCYSIEEFKKIYEHCLEPVEGEENWPISSNPGPIAPGYIRMPGRPKKNDRRREEGEAPKGKKMNKHGIQIKCGLCGNMGHNKRSCKENGGKGPKKNATIAKAGRKIKAAEQAKTDAHINASQQASGRKRKCKEQGNGVKEKKGKNGQK